MKTLHRYQPRSFASLQAYYELFAGERGGLWNPEVMPTIEWIEILVNGKVIDANTSAHFFETFGERWERDILNDYGYSL